MKFFFSLLLFLSFSNVSSQILNVESLRKVTDTSGFSGSISLDFSVKRDVKNYLGFENSTHLQYQMKRHLILLKNDIQFQSVEGDKFQNSGITHLRYNYKITSRFTWEVFGQAQYNKVAKIDFRGLAGSGPRFKLSDSEKYKFYLGALAMYEYEKLRDDVEPFRELARGSMYFTASIYPTDNITFITTTYYQPKFKEFSDYVFSNQSSLLIKLFDNFAFKTSYTFVFDAYPAEGIPNSQYNLTSGVVYSFE